MKKIIIYDDEDYGLTVELGEYTCPCRHKGDVLGVINDEFYKLRETTEEEREAPCQAE